MNQLPRDSVRIPIRDVAPCDVPCISGAFSHVVSTGVSVIVRPIPVPHPLSLNPKERRKSGQERKERSQVSFRQMGMIQDDSST